MRVIPILRKRSIEEARAFSRVRHPGIVSLYQAVESEPWLYLVLEFVPGGTLKSWLKGPVSSVAAAGLMVKVATAVDQIHQAGLIHLDLKPSNVLLEAGGDVALHQVAPKIADFGVARLRLDRELDPGETGTTLVGPWGGTPSYMAPEQISGARADLGRPPMSTPWERSSMSFLPAGRHTTVRRCLRRLSRCSAWRPFPPAG